jgi:cupin superfamily protein
MVRLLDIEGGSFRDAFAKRGIVVRHFLLDHPLLSMEAIAELADELPPESVRRERADVPLTVAGKIEDIGEGPPSRTIQEIENNRCRVALREIQSIPRYAELINNCLDEAATYVADREGGMIRRAGYIFVSPSKAVTPMHFDPEHSFLLQIRGAKKVSITAFANPAVRERELDRYYDGNPSAFDAMAAEATTFSMEPGDGVYIPSLVPHWVETEEGLAVSFSIPFYTDYSQRAELVHRVNIRLRRLHLTPRPPGHSRVIDSVKAATYRSWTRLRGLREKARA